MSKKRLNKKQKNLRISKDVEKCAEKLVNKSGGTFTSLVETLIINACNK